MAITLTRAELKTLTELAARARVTVVDGINLAPLFQKLVDLINGTQDLHTPGTDAGDAASLGEQLELPLRAS